MKAKVCIEHRLRLSALYTLLTLLLASSPLLAESSALRSRRDFIVGDHPVGIVAADYDGDGFLDLITVNQQTAGVGDIALVKGFGDGTFRKVSSLSSGALPSGIVYTDVNGDGRSDLVLSNLRSQEVTVHLGNASGGFGAKISSPVVGTPTGLTVGDWNADGKKDVALMNGPQSNMVILLGDGVGHFPTVRQTFVIGASSKHTLSADFNNDGKLDVAVANNGASAVQVFRGDGTGLFTLTNTLTTGAGPVALAIANFNGDAFLDIATANSAGDTLSIFLGTASGFGSPTSLSPGFGPRGLAVADVNKDTRLDLVVSLGKVSQEGQVALMTGNGTGGFTLANTYFVGPAPNWTTVGDFNRDGNLDLVTANNTGNTVSIVASIGTATFLIPGRIPLPFGSFPASVLIADFNGDGKRDVATANEFLNNISLVSGDGLCGFTTVNSANNTGITPIAMASADFNHDNCLDIVIANNADGTYSYLQNSATCSGNFSVNNGNQVGCLDPIAVATGDVNGDGNADFAITCETAGELCSRRGTGTSSPPFGSGVCVPGATSTPEGLAIGAFTLDAFDDYALTSSPSPPGDPTDIIAIARSDGLGGVVDIPATFPVGLEPRGIARGDLNGDGFLDLVVANSGTNNVSALLGDGGGVFTFPSIDSPAGQAPTALTLADFNLDGKLDVAVINTNANNVSLLLGDRTGHFTKAGDYGTRDLPLAIGAGDCNGDGWPDIAVADNFNDTVTVLVNQTVAGDPLNTTNFFGQTNSVYTWGVVAGATYDVIRGLMRSVTPGPSTNSLGPVTCLSNDQVETDTAALPDNSNPPSGDIYFYLVRSTVGGVSGPYTVSAPAGKPGVPSSGGCP